MRSHDYARARASAADGSDSRRFSVRSWPNVASSNACQSPLSTGLFSRIRPFAASDLALLALRRLPCRQSKRGRNRDLPAGQRLDEHTLGNTTGGDAILSDTIAVRAVDDATR